MYTTLIRAFVVLVAGALLTFLSAQAGGASTSILDSAQAPVANSSPIATSTFDIGELGRQSIQPSREQVGEEVPVANLQTRHPYRLAREAVLTEEIHLPGASYIAPHFSRFDLAPGDWLVLRSPDGTRQWRYEGEGKPGMGRNGGFWGIPIPGDRAIIELHGANNHEGWGYRIDKVARGFAHYDEPPNPICGADDKRNARCYETSHPNHYDQSRAVLRLHISGIYLCTGWLLGPNGHVMTNGHCIETMAEAQDTAYEVMAEGACSQTCSTLQCPGNIVSNFGTLVRRSFPTLDYALIKLNVNPATTYGYMKLRQQPSQLGERLYIPQHPGGWGKQIALHSTHPDDPTGYPQVQDTLGNDLLYFADINYGSSGSPVLSHDDHCVIALHSSTLGCDVPMPGNTRIGNVGAKASLIIADLGSDLPPGAVAGPGEFCGRFPEDIIFKDDFELL